MYEYEKYVCSPSTLRATLDTFGVAIIPSILSDEECEQMIDGVWEFLHHITQHWPIPIHRDNQETYKEIHKLHLLRGAMFQQYSNGHSQYMWNLRQNRKIVNIFSEFWGVPEEELLASFDGSNFSIPNNELQTGGKRAAGKTRTAGLKDVEPWYHLDQSLTRPDFECAQSWVTAYDTGEGDATLGFLEGSHAWFSQFAEETTAISVVDWKLLSKAELDFYRSKGCSEKRIACPRGSLVVWDSRTVHYGAPSLKRPAEQTFRLVGYLCYRPRYFITQEMLAEKRMAFDQHDTTSHHPTNFRIFRKLPPKITLDHCVTPIDPPVVSELGKRLAGF